MPDNCIEVSFEVANKVGGIYQVLKSKCGKMKDFYGDGYWTVGFYNEEKARDDFAERSCPPELENAKKELEKIGVEVHCGAWRIPGSPKCILLDVSGMNVSADDIKKEMWDNYEIDSMDAGHDFNEPIQWSYAVGQLIKHLENDLEGDTVVQLHEWLSGIAGFYIDSATVFTTHATVLGRALSNADFELQEAVERGDSLGHMAGDYGVKAKHMVESTAAEDADAFTTVSNVTADEAEAVLGVRPDVVLPNGFNVEEFPALEDLSYQHKNKKDKMKQFLHAYFEPYYDAQLEEDPRILFISGRYEFHNKGVDTFLDALGQLNQKEGDEIYAFIFIPSDVSGPRSDVIENMSLYQELEDYLDNVMPQVRNQLLNALTSDEDPGESLKELVNTTSNNIESLQRNFHSKDGNPPLCAFDLNYAEDEIINHAHSVGLNNAEEDRVKIVFYPTYLSMGDRLLSMGYQDAIKASTAGIFPSYYEPWGYTPVETAANGALSITTDLAGFGQFLEENTDEDDRKGIRVLDRKDVSDEEATDQLAEMIEDIVNYSKTEITERKHNARKLAQLTSWEKLGENYRKAHELAVKNNS
jgi:glycogen(starch) synthase